MAIDFNKFGKSQSSASASSSQNDVSVSSPVTTSKVSSGKVDFNKFGKSGTYQPPTVAPKQEEGSMVGNMVKGLISAPATLLARPLQAAESAGQLIGSNTEELAKIAQDKSNSDLKIIKLRNEKRARGEDTIHLDNYIKTIAPSNEAAVKEISDQANWKPTSGGIIAPAPETFKDVKKDVGRGMETVALGLGPVSGGALFGAGSSMEQGNDLLSAETAIQTALGVAGGKVLGWVGKPILNTAGKVIGKITPQILTDLASKGAGAIQKFAAENKLLGGVLEKPSAMLEKTANKIDTGVDSLFSKAGTKAKEAVVSQYPSLSKTNREAKYTKIEQKALLEPTTIPGKYSESKKIYNNAKSQGNSIEEAAKLHGINTDELSKGRNYDTLDAVAKVEEDTMKRSNDLLRPYLKEAAPGVQRVTSGELIDGMINEVKSTPATKMDANEKLKRIQQIWKDYGPGSANAKVHPDGYDLVNLHDQKINRANKARIDKYGNVPDNFSATQAEMEADVFRKLVEERAPDKGFVKSFNKKLQESFQLAEYLRSLNNKPVPTSMVRKGFDLAGKLLGSSAGYTVGGPLAAITGYHAGGAITNYFTGLPNPIKAAVLRNMAVENPAAFQAIKDSLGKMEFERIMRAKAGLWLKGGSKIDANLSKMGNKSGAIEMGAPNRPITEAQRMSNDVIQNAKILRNTKQISAPSPRLIVPNTQGTPNQPGVDYGTPEVGGMRQKKKIRDIYNK